MVGRGCPRGWVCILLVVIVGMQSQSQYKLVMVYWMKCAAQCAQTVTVLEHGRHTHANLPKLQLSELGIHTSTFIHGPR